MQRRVNKYLVHFFHLGKSCLKGYYFAGYHVYQYTQQGNTIIDNNNNMRLAVLALIDDSMQNYPKYFLNRSVYNINTYTRCCPIIRAPHLSLNTYLFMYSGIRVKSLRVLLIAYQVKIKQKYDSKVHLGFKECQMIVWHLLMSFYTASSKILW